MSDEKKAGMEWLAYIDERVEGNKGHHRLSLHADDACSAFVQIWYSAEVF